MTSYKDFVKAHYKKAQCGGGNPRDTMRILSKMWQHYKTSGGELIAPGDRQDGGSFKSVMGDIGKVALKAAPTVLPLLAGLGNDKGGELRPVGGAHRPLPWAIKGGKRGRKCKGGELIAPGDRQDGGSFKSVMGDIGKVALKAAPTVLPLLAGLGNKGGELEPAGAGGNPVPKKQKLKGKKTKTKEHECSCGKMTKVKLPLDGSVKPIAQVQDLHVDQYKEWTGKQLEKIENKLESIWDQQNRPYAFNDGIVQSIPVSDQYGVMEPLTRLFYGTPLSSISMPTAPRRIK